MDTQFGAAPEGNAIWSRPAGLRRGGESWIRPFRRSRRAIDSSERRIGMSLRIIEDCETRAAEHPILAAHAMQRASRLIDEAAERLVRSHECIRQTFDRIAEAPADSLDAPERLIDAMERWLETARLLALLSKRFDETFFGLIDYLYSGHAPLDFSELLKKRTFPVPVIVRHPAPKVLSIENDRIFCIHVRRQRPARLAVAEAPTRVSRGRAPPAVSICSL